MVPEGGWGLVGSWELEVGSYRRLGLPRAPLPQDVDEDRRHDDAADHDHLPVRGHIEEVEAVAQEADDQRADQRPGDCPDAAEEAGTADDDGRNRIEFGAGSSK